MSATQHSSVSL